MLTTNNNHARSTHGVSSKKASNLTTVERTLKVHPYVFGVSLLLANTMSLALKIDEVPCVVTDVNSDLNKNLVLSNELIKVELPP